MKRGTPLRGVLGAIIAALAGCGSATEHRDHVVPVSGGSFRMGVPESRIAELRTQYGVSFPGSFENEIPEHDVTVSSFLMDRFEVTNDRFSDFVAAHREWGPGRLSVQMHNGRYLDHWTARSYRGGTADHPVVFVTWHAAQRFCEWAGGRLPTEAEWEYAARAGSDREFPWGDELPSPERANYGASAAGRPMPVGSYPPNPLGLYDMAGNVWEWMFDEWEPSCASGPRVDPITGRVPVGATDSVRGRRSIRGGSFGGAVVNLRVRWRDSHDVVNAMDSLGFRCVYPAQDRGGQ